MYVGIPYVRFLNTFTYKRNKGTHAKTQKQNIKLQKKNALGKAILNYMQIGWLIIMMSLGGLTSSPVGIIYAKDVNKRTNVPYN